MSTFVYDLSFVPHSKEAYGDDEYDEAIDALGHLSVDNNQEVSRTLRVFSFPAAVKDISSSDTTEGRQAFTFLLGQIGRTTVSKRKMVSGKQGCPPFNVSRLRLFQEIPIPACFGGLSLFVIRPSQR